MMNLGAVYPPVD